MILIFFLFRQNRFWGQKCKKCNILWLPYRLKPITCRFCRNRRCICTKKDISMRPKESDRHHRSEYCEKCLAGEKCQGIALMPHQLSHIHQTRNSTSVYNGFRQFRYCCIAVLLLLTVYYALLQSRLYKVCILSNSFVNKDNILLKFK